MRTLLVFALLLLAVPALALDDRNVIEGYRKVACDDYGDYYVDSTDIYQRPGYVGVYYHINFKTPNPRGVAVMGEYHFDCKGNYRVGDAAYLKEGESSTGLVTTGEEERQETRMRTISDPSIAAVAEYACR